MGGQNVNPYISPERLAAFKSRCSGLSGAAREDVYEER